MKCYMQSALLVGVMLMLAQPVGAQVSKTLSTAGPRTQAQKVYNLLCDLENNSRNGVRKQTIMGHHDEAHKENPVGQYWIRVGEIAGKNPGFVEFDFGPGNYRSTYQENYVDYAVGFTRDRFIYGQGIVGFSFHQSYPGAPVKSFENNFTQSWMDYNWMAKVINWQSNTWEYQQLLQDLSFAADKLAILQQNNVPVLFRPFHEMNKNGFWWAQRDPVQYKQLWSIMWNYMVNTRGLKNLIFVWSPYEWDGTYGSAPWSFYPGANMVDVVGVDIYHGNPYHPGQFYTDLQGYNKPRMLAETDKMPVRWGDGTFETVSDIDSRPWVIWSVWGDTLQYNVGATSPNQWNISSNYKAVKDTYDYYSNGYWRTLSGGANGTYNWGGLR